jgi:hypothetical protein
MTVKPDAVAWLLSHFGVKSPSTYASKYYIPEQSWTGRDAWWFEIPRAAIETPRSAEVHLLLQVVPNAKEFHYLCVPTSFLKEQLPKLTLQKSDKVSLFLSAEPHNMFVDQRGRGKVAFSKFLRT